MQKKSECDCLLFLIFCLGFTVALLIAILIFVFIQHQTLDPNDAAQNKKQSEFGVSQIDFSREHIPKSNDEFYHILAPLKSQQIESDNLYKSLRDEIDVLKLPNECAFIDQLYECKGAYFDNFTHFNDDWSKLMKTEANISWHIPSEIHSTFDGKKKEFEDWRYSVINYPIIPKFVNSKKERSHIRISIVTQTSMDRLDLIELISQNWDGVISVAIYVRLEESLLHSLQLILELFERIDTQYSAILDICVLFETDYLYKRTPKKGLHSVMYPVNHLRNLALQTAKTELVLLTDGDFIPSKDFHDLASRQYDIARNSTQNNVVLVIPAFEFGSSYFGYSKKQKNAKRIAIKKEEAMISNLNITNLSDLPLTKERVIELYQKDQIRGFHIHRCTSCHKPTNYSKWIESDRPYPVKYKASYEPYIMTKRVGLHRYDARFRGYGWNKIVHLLTLAWLDKSEWIVANDLFIFHIPHSSSQDAKNYFKGSKSERWKWISGLSKLALRDLKKKIDQTGYIVS